MTLSAVVKYVDQSRRYLYVTHCVCGPSHLNIYITRTANCVLDLIQPIVRIVGYNSTLCHCAQALYKVRDWKTKKVITLTGSTAQYNTESTTCAVNGLSIS